MSRKAVFLIMSRKLTDEQRRHKTEYMREYMARYRADPANADKLRLWRQNYIVRAAARLAQQDGSGANHDLREGGERG